jgi:hypothetical protein
LNRYSYVWNNPLSLVDPSGFQAQGGETPNEDCKLGALEKCTPAQRRALECLLMYCSTVYANESGNTVSYGEFQRRLQQERDAITQSREDIRRMNEEYQDWEAGRAAENAALELASAERQAATLEFLGNVMVLIDIATFPSGEGLAAKIALKEAAEELLEKAAARSVPRIRGPAFDGLKDHAARHSVLHPNRYYNAAVRHLESGTKFTFRHDGQFKNAFITRAGPDSFTFTSASRSGDRIFTHIDDVNSQYLRNIGITLPQGF